MPKRIKKQVSAARAVDEQLARYRAMRDFSLTTEPSGGAQSTSTAELPFVVQKHDATRLHYDFRLGWRGVLKSWAVAKGPSYSTRNKRLAVEVEDHPIEYGGFEGTIPKGQYGGGTVMVWDQGSWQPQPGEDVDEGLKKGRLKFILYGKKLKGKWTLVRMGGRASHESKPNWLLMKEHDEYEASAEDPPITETAPNSVITGRSIEEIAAQEDHIWQSKPSRLRPNRSRPARLRSEALAASRRESALRDVPREALPRFISPQLAAPVADPPRGEQWLHELKLDGYRIQLRIEQRGNGKRSVQTLTRKGLDWTHRFSGLAEEAARLPVKTALVDGEAVVLDSSGKSSFAGLQKALEEQKLARLKYFAFDLLHLDGHNLRRLPLERRKVLLKALLDEMPQSDTILYSEHIRGNGDEAFRHACKLGAEGIISKLAASEYESARGKNWVKAKCVLQQEFVIGGFTPSSDGSHGIGSLLLGYFQDGKLLYAGRTGTGFTQASRRALRKQLDLLRQAKTPFQGIHREESKGAVWVRPELVAAVQFATWTGDHRVRQASFQGLREDKPAEEVQRENMAAIPRVSQATIPSRRAKEDHKTSGTSGEVASDAGHGKERKSAAAMVHLTHPDKLLDEETGLTKRQLAEYYEAVAEHLLPHIVNRPLSIVRCPEGSGKPCFFQKHIGSGLPRGMDRVDVPGKKGSLQPYLTISGKEGLTGLAQMGVLEVHPWGSQNSSLEMPDRIIFDLDPGPAVDWKVVVESACEVRDVLKELGLTAFVKSTGGKGLHVVAPILPDHEWAEVKRFTHNVVLALEQWRPDRYLTRMTKSARRGRIFLDYLRNERGATAVAAWSPRARKGVRVALPLRWDEIGKGNPEDVTVASFRQWKKRLEQDPWAELLTLKQPLTKKAIRAAASLAPKST